MQSRFDGYNHIIRLDKGELLIDSLSKWAIEKGVAGGWISGIGAARWVELGYYDLKKQNYNWKKIKDLVEIDSLQGNLAWIDDTPAIHLHATFSDSKMRTTGGHVKELEVGGTCEVFVHATFGPQLTRFLNKDTGLKLLDL